MAGMTIAKLARGAGVGVETVRYYQRRGLLPTPRAAGETYREYDPEHLRRLRFIRRAQTAGFTLEEIGELLSLDRSSERPRVQALAKARLEALDARMAELDAARKSLRRLLGACHGGGAGPCPIIEAFDVEAQPPHLSGSAG